VTDRLILRWLTEDDAEGLFELDFGPEAQCGVECRMTGGECEALR